MLLKQIKYFVSVAANGSFTKAAAECYISQSAISQQIQSLEAELGVRLIERENRRFHLTEAGAFFYQQSQILLNDFDKICAITRQIEKTGRQKLRIGYLSGYTGIQFHQAVAEFSEAHPDIDIEVVSGTHEELYDMHVAKSADLTFSDQRRAFSDAFNNFFIFSAYVHIELAAKNALAAKEYLTMADLADTPCILISDASRQKQEEDYYRNYLHFKGLFRLADNRQDGRMQVSANRGFLLLEGPKDLPQVGITIKRLPLYESGRPLQKNYYAYWPKENADPNCQRFADILRRSFAGQ